MHISAEGHHAGRANSVLRSALTWVSSTTTTAAAAAEPAEVALLAVVVVGDVIREEVETAEKAWWGGLC